MTLMDQIRSLPDQISNPTHVNVGQNERSISLAIGTLIAAYGLTRGSLSGLATAAIGAGLIYRGATGHCPTYEKLNIDTTHQGA